MKGKHYQLRADAELLEALKAAGPDKVRQILREHLGVHTPTQDARVYTQPSKVHTPKERDKVHTPTVVQPAKLTLAEMVEANEAKMQAKKARIALGNGLVM